MHTTLDSLNHTFSMEHTPDRNHQPTFQSRRYFSRRASINLLSFTSGRTKAPQMSTHTSQGCSLEKPAEWANYGENKDTTRSYKAFPLKFSETKKPALATKKQPSNHVHQGPSPSFYQLRRIQSHHNPLRSLTFTGAPNQQVPAQPVPLQQLTGPVPSQPQSNPTGSNQILGKLSKMCRNLQESTGFLHSINKIQSPNQQHREQPAFFQKLQQSQNNPYQFQLDCQYQQQQRSCKPLEKSQINVRGLAWECAKLPSFKSTHHIQGGYDSSDAELVSKKVSFHNQICTETVPENNMAAEDRTKLARSLSGADLLSLQKNQSTHEPESHQNQSHMSSSSVTNPTVSFPLKRHNTINNLTFNTASKTRTPGSMKLEFKTSPLTFKKTVTRKVSGDYSNGLIAGRGSNNSCLSWQQPKIKARVSEEPVKATRGSTGPHFLGETCSSVGSLQSAQFMFNSMKNQNTLASASHPHILQNGSEPPQLRDSNNSAFSGFSRKSPGLRDFQKLRDLGSGKYGEVWLVRHWESGFICAMKCINKDLIREQKLQDQLVREIKIQSYCKHPNIAQLYGYFSDSKRVYLLVELCCDGHMRGYLDQNNKKLEQAVAKPLIRQICSGVEYLHRNEILHRDIKPENMLLHEGVLKLCDFGWSVHMHNSLRSTFCGTPLYVSPDILQGNSYDQKIDIWSVGIIAYETVVGRIPFQISRPEDLAKIIYDDVTFPEEIALTNECKDFINNLLRKDPNQRQDLEGMLYHAFLR